MLILYLLLLKRTNMISLMVVLQSFLWEKTEKNVFGDYVRKC